VNNHPNGENRPIWSPWTHFKKANILNLFSLHLSRGSNPAIVSYNTSGVKIYNARNSTLRFYNLNVFFLILIIYNNGMRSLVRFENKHPANYAGVVVVLNSEVVGLALFFKL
jgi:hypothetical protein